MRRPPPRSTLFPFRTLSGSLKDTNGNTLATTTTAADGTYSFANLVAGTYSVSAPAMAAGYNLETPSPLSVPVVAGLGRPHVITPVTPPSPIPPSASVNAHVN